MLRTQEELLTLGLEALRRGEKVVRLKQGDPYIFGRGGEEFNFSRNMGSNQRLCLGSPLHWRHRCCQTSQ